MLLGAGTANMAAIDAICAPSFDGAFCQTPNATGSTLARMALAGEARILLTFGGQGQPFLEDLEELYHQGGGPRAVIEACAAALLDETTGATSDADDRRSPLVLISWLRSPETRPSDEVLTTAPVSYPLIFVAQAARLASLATVGLGPEAIGEWAWAVTGHSQGIIAAWLAAQALGPAELRERAALLARFMRWVGRRKQGMWRPPDDTGPAMVEIKGLTADETTLAIGTLEGVFCQIHNGPRRHVVAGPPAQMTRLVQRLGHRHPRQRRVSLTPLSCSAPFHSPYMAGAIEPLRGDAERLGVRLSAESLALSILRYEDGEVWQGDPCLISSLCVGALDWPATLDSARRRGISHIIDLGPHDGMARLATSLMEGYGIRVVAATTEDGRTVLSGTRPEEIAPPEPWGARALRRISGASGRTSAVNAFTTRTGLHPIILLNASEQRLTPAALPLVDEDGIVRSERRACRRIGELLDPIVGRTFDALSLEPSRIDDGHYALGPTAETQALSGVSVNVGSRPLEESVALLKVLAGYQLRLCCLAIDDEVQLARALSIADALPDLTLTLHVGAGRSVDRLDPDRTDDLLVSWYARIRCRSNLLIMVRSEMGTPSHVRSLLTGSWSTALAYPPMPIDAVSIDGSRARLSRETPLFLTDTWLLDQ